MERVTILYLISRILYLRPGGCRNFPFSIFYFSFPILVAKSWKLLFTFIFLYGKIYSVKIGTFRIFSPKSRPYL